MIVACSDSPAVGPALCSQDTDCGVDEICHLGACRSQCSKDDDCEQGWRCVSGICLTDCTGDGDCPPGEECQAGFCKPKNTDPDGGPDGGGPTCQDEDGDRYGTNCAPGPDCDDSVASIHPGAVERCFDDRDNDCDGQTDEEDCRCQPGDLATCYPGSAETQDVGACQHGVRVCQEDNTYGDCQGAILPGDEVCDGEDNDCDGDTDEELLNDCGECLPPNDQLVEQCGNSLDDNCDGFVDEGCDCDPNCACDQGGAGTYCECHPPTHQPCYSGPPGTLGLGICKGGFHDCSLQPDSSYAWSVCAGQVLPAAECENDQSNGLDDDCDGMTDEGCLPDSDGDGYAPPQDCDDGDKDVHPGAPETCNGEDDDCDGIADEGVTNMCGECGPTEAETCGDGLDNDCNGTVDDGCGGCSGGQTRDCYTGPPATIHIGQCAFGQQTCDGEFWSDCQGDTLPELEVCDEQDNDCDGETDEKWAIGANACGFCDGTEECDGQDNDCDGLTDEGMVNGCGQCLPVPEETECDGQDNDCDGLTDEGLLNACGTCGDSCYTEDWSGEEDWPQGQADGVSNAVDPDELRLDSTTQSPHYIWIAGTTVVCSQVSGCVTNPACYEGQACHTVKKFDTHTNELIGVYSTWGWSPSRTAVAVDNTVWVGNRGCANNLSNCDGDDPRHGNAVHLDADGNLICRADVVGVQDVESSIAVRAVTIDKDGNAWLGSWSGGKIYKYSGTEVVANADGIPRCAQMCVVDLGGSRAYGAAVDDNGFLWIATLGYGALKKVNTATCEVVGTVNPGRQTYGIAVDMNNNPWYGCWDGACPCAAIKVNASDNSVQCIGRTQGDTGGGQTRGVAVDDDGNIWVAEWSHNTVSKFNPSGNHLGQWSVSGHGITATGPLGMGIDFDNNIWAVNYGSSYASKYSPDGTLLSVFDIGPSSYTYSDMTGFQLRNITLKFGSWTVDYDSGYADAKWDRVQWTGSMGPDDQIRLRVRSAPSQGELTAPGNVFSSYFDADPGQQPPWSMNIQGSVPDNRWLQLEVTLTTEDEVSPAFSGLEVFWQR